MDFGVDGNVTGDDILGDSLEVDNDRIDDEIEIETGGSSVEIAFHHDEKLHQDGGESVGIPLDEPFVGKEFDSEAEAHAFYNAYATRVGFVIRVSKLSRSRRDGSAIGRALVCNKEGYRMPDKREKVVRQRAETRVGCRAMILVRKVDSGKWVITKFVKEHTHALTPGKGRRDLIYDQYPDDKDRKIQDLINELRIKKRLSATYRDQLFELMKDVEEHNDNLAVKVQGVRDKLRALESRKLVPPRPR